MKTLLNHTYRHLSVTALLIGLASPMGIHATDSLPLAGEWRFALDRTDVGVAETWYNRDLPDRIQLPGVLQSQGYGDEINTNTPWVLSLHDRNWFMRQDYIPYTRPGDVKVPFVCQPPRHYLGAAWYQRDIEIPTHWAGRRVLLFLERTRWETQAWLDDRPLGTNNSLCVPHEFEAGVVGTAGDGIQPGRHRLTVRCDNRMLMRYRPDAHAVSDSLGSTWNGIAGSIELRSTPRVWVEDVRVFPDVKTKTIRIQRVFRNRSGKHVEGKISYVVEAAPGTPACDPLPVSENFNTTVVSNGAMVEMRLGDDALAWDEFSSPLYRLRVGVRGEIDGRFFEHETMTRFGLRDFRTQDRDFVVNGRPTHLRGTHHGGDFPLTGYPPCDVEYWLQVWRTCKKWGLNHVRFHSFCPPEAAFTAADQVGLYLQVEPGMWNEISPGTPIESMLYQETDAILRAYGNHPSFVLMSASNEAKGHWKESLPRWVQHFRKLDPRRLYTPDTGWSLIDDPQPVADQADFLAVHRVGRRMMRGTSGWFGRDYANSYEGVDVPNIVHENGQWCAYPDYSVIGKFTGYMRPGNFEIFKNSMASHGLIQRNTEFARASGRFQLACYKEEVEANLRTPGLGGFQLLDLHDYVGQGTALVGLLDPFWEDKSYVKAGEWRQFCSPVVPLARLTQYVFTTDDPFEVPVEVANFGLQPLTNAVVAWQIVDSENSVVMKGDLSAQTLSLGRSPRLGRVRIELPKLSAPGHYRLVISVLQSPHPQDASTEVPVLAENSWNFWLYPAEADRSVPNEVLLTSAWDEAETRLASGGRVVFQPPQANLDWFSPPLDRVPVFWNRLMNPQWSRMLGLWCDTNHPALAGFPTQENCDWQWTQIIKTRAMNLGWLPRELKPIVSAIDDWNRNWKLGLVFEARVGAGRLLVSTFDLGADHPVAAQLRRSLLDYAASNQFQPAVTVAPEAFRAAWFDNRLMSKLKATAKAQGGDAQAVLDGDPNTYWLTGAPSRGVPAVPHPHELTISFPEPTAMSGLVLMNRQNDRNHQGDIRGYTLAVSDDGKTWREILTGELGSTWDPQTVAFPAIVTATHLKLTATSGYGEDPSAALAELAIIYAGEAIERGEAGTLEYKRVRSTSSDVDEGD